MGARTVIRFWWMNHVAVGNDTSEWLHMHSLRLWNSLQGNWKIWHPSSGDLILKTVIRIPPLQKKKTKVLSTHTIIANITHSKTITIGLIKNSENEIKKRQGEGGKDEGMEEGLRWRRTLIGVTPTQTDVSRTSCTRTNISTRFSCCLRFW